VVMANSLYHIGAELFFFSNLWVISTQKYLVDCQDLWHNQYH
jgi:hypothetical protein